MIEMPSIFGDNMVLQQDRPLIFWGKTTPGQSVTVHLPGQSATAQAGPDGSWKATLKPMPAGGPYEVTIEGTETLRFQNVLIGEVWLASGQSNMEMTVAESSDAPREIQAAYHPQLRIYQATRTFEDEPAFTVEGKWVVCTPETIGQISAVAYAFGRDLQESFAAEGKPQAVGTIIASWGGTPAIAWTPRPTLKASAKYQERTAHYEAEPAETRAKHTSPSVLFNGMIAPLAPYALKGFLWFQGESDALNNESYSYRTLLPLMIENWRQTWGGGNLPFLIVQISSFVNYTPTSFGPYGDDSRPDAPLTGSTWAELREAQAMTALLPGNGMVVTTDLGDPQYIHFPNKREVGRRLALVARKQVYGQPMIAAGPRFLKVENAGQSMRVSFTQTDQGLKSSGDELKGFTIAGEDRKFLPAQAVIEKDTVVVSAPSVSNPIAIRYNWATNAQGNLFNRAGLPAEPFRSDDWPGITK